MPCRRQEELLNVVARAAGAVVLAECLRRLSAVPKRSAERFLSAQAEKNTSD